MAQHFELEDDKTGKTLDLVSSGGKTVVPIANPDGSPVGSTSGAPVKTAAVDLAPAVGGGDNLILAAVPGKKLRVLFYLVSAKLGTEVFWKSGAATKLSARKFLPATGGVVADSPSGAFLFETASGEALNLNSSSAVFIGVDVVYQEI
jgi:hypothetical protein